MSKWPFACRTVEVELMEAAIRGGRGVVIVGDAGVGKSRVLLELCSRLEDSDVTVHRVAATTSLSTVPYGAFASALSRGGDHGGGIHGRRIGPHGIRHGIGHTVSVQA